MRTETSNACHAALSSFSAFSSSSSAISPSIGLRNDAGRAEVGRGVALQTLDDFQRADARRRLEFRRRLTHAGLVARHVVEQRGQRLIVRATAARQPDPVQRRGEGLLFADLQVDPHLAFREKVQLVRVLLQV